LSTRNVAARHNWSTHDGTFVKNKLFFSKINMASAGEAPTFWISNSKKGICPRFCHVTFSISRRELVLGHEHRVGANARRLKRTLSPKLAVHPVSDPTRCSGPSGGRRAAVRRSALGARRSALGAPPARRAKHRVANANARHVLDPNAARRVRRRSPVRGFRARASCRAAGALPWQTSSPTSSW